MKNIAFSLIGILFVFFFLPEKERHERSSLPKPPVFESRWTGKLTLEERTTSITGISERKVTVNFVNVLPTLFRDGPNNSMDPDSVLYGQQDSTDYTSDFTDDKGTGSVTFHGEAIIAGKKIGISDCSGSGKSQLNEVSLDIRDNTYRIHAIGPACIGTDVSLLDGRTEPHGPEFTDIIVDGEQIVNKHLLAGSKTEEIDLGGDLGKVTRTTTWYLATDNAEVELIVTPENYNDWMPEPGANELTKGNSIKIDLKLIGRNGQPPTKKARSFKLTLNNTSSEPGITLNAPLTPISTLPDLRFMVQSNAAVADQFQNAGIRPADGKTASIVIGSFDGGGYTTLTVKAILDDNSEIEGHLLISGGNTEIPIPKRPAGSNIATKWLVAHNNPHDDYDIETSQGCNNNGDGLTAYEEYRGVMARAGYTRLDPEKKEVGIWLAGAEAPMFWEGLGQFENATDLKPIRFNESQVWPDRKFNKNSHTSHSNDQYALKVSKRHLKRGVYGRAMGGPGIPKVVKNIYIDLDQIYEWHNDMQLEAAAQHIATPYTVTQLIAKTVAHELGHGISIPHHGNHLTDTINRWVEVEDPIRIFYPRNSGEVPKRYRLIGSFADAGGQLSGDVFCLMNYYPTIDFSIKILPDVTLFYMVPRVRLGTSFCNSAAGTDFNATLYYFGDAENGDCLSRIKLK